MKMKIEKSIQMSESGLGDFQILLDDQVVLDETEIGHIFIYNFDQRLDGLLLFFERFVDLVEVVGVVELLDGGG